MKIFKSNFIIAIIALISLSACEKVIDIDLNSSDPQYVITGEVSDLPGPYLVTIKRSVNFDESNSFPLTSGAIVIISDDAGNTETLTESSPGVYTTNTLQGVIGRTYHLSVSVDGKTFESTSKMPAPVAFDSVIFQTLGGLGNTIKAATPYFQDPVGIGNSYWFVQYVNGIKDKNVYAIDDRLADGLFNTRPLASANSDLEINVGDTLDIYMRCIDHPTYEYMNGVSNLSGGDPLGSATPANPVSNITGGALGYFTAYSSQHKRVTVPN